MALGGLLSLLLQMQLLDNYLEKNAGKVFVILILLAIPAFFTNLGLLPLFADEPTRATVSLEMILSGNYSVPTIGDEFYYNKPPFYNWILALCYHLTGSYSEFVTRLPAEIPMFLFAITIFITVKYFLNDSRIALVSGMFFMLGGRVLLYDSMLGHIDIFYSWLIYISFISIWYYYEKGEWFKLFLISYLITAVAFLCKGLPSIVFQGCTILTLLLYFRNFRKLFSWQHLFSGILCVLIIAGYFYNYTHYNSDLKKYFETIWDQSSQRTAGRVDAGKSLNHLFSFPFEHLWHLFPASLMLIFAIRKGFTKHIKQNGFLTYISLIAIVNSIVYWLSPETRPRYLLMLYPLVIIVAAYTYFTWRDESPRLKNVFKGILILISALVLLAIPVAVVAGKLPPVTLLGFKVGFLIAVLSILIWLVVSLERNYLIPFMAILIVVRLGFSWFVLPERAARHEGNSIKLICSEMAQISKNKPFYLYQYHPQVLSLPYHHRIIFYLERSRMSKVKFIEGDTSPGYYFTFDRNLRNKQARLLKTYHGNLRLFEVQ